MFASYTPWAIRRAASPAVIPVPPLPIRVAASSNLVGGRFLLSASRCAHAMTAWRTRLREVRRPQLSLLTEADDDDGLRARHEGCPARDSGEC